MFKPLYNHGPIHMIVLRAVMMERRVRMGLLVMVMKISLSAEEIQA